MIQGENVNENYFRYIIKKVMKESKDSVKKKYYIKKLVNKLM
jgi:hypothetical protein